MREIGDYLQYFMLSTDFFPVSQFVKEVLQSTSSSRRDKIGSSNRKVATAQFALYSWVVFGRTRACCMQSSFQKDIALSSAVGTLMKLQAELEAYGTCDSVKVEERGRAMARVLTREAALCDTS
jgi:hypothetical protein